MNAHAVAEHIMTELSEGRDGSICGKGVNVPTKGFMVGGKSWTLTAQTENFDSYTVLDFVTAHRAALSWEDTYVGWWTHKGRVYLDVADNIPDRDSAVHMGTQRGEIAIWDICKSQEITL
jgi:hypothetical protein